MSVSSAPTLYVNEDGMLEFVCQQCGYVKTIAARQISRIGRGFRFRCRCGKRYEVDLRRHYRKKVKLPGTYVNLSRPGTGKMVVENISLGGLAFVASANHFVKDDLVRLEFSLDDTQKREISITAAVQHTGEDGYVGARIHDTNYHEKDLYYYLLP